jgi:hypothetical protein
LGIKKYSSGTATIYSLYVTLVLFIGSHNMQLSIMLNSLLVGVYPPIEIRIEANLLEDFVTVMFSQAFNCKYSECIIEYSLVLACEMDFYDTDIYIQYVYSYQVILLHETLQLWLP